MLAQKLRKHIATLVKPLKPAPSKPANNPTRGATPVHYRAIDRADNRKNIHGLDDPIYQLKEAAKMVKFLDDSHLRSQALRVLDRFAEFSEIYCADYEKALTREKRTELSQQLISYVTDSHALLTSIIASDDNDQREIYLRYSRQRVLTEA